MHWMEVERSVKLLLRNGCVSSILVGGAELVNYVISMVTVF